jgi:GH43 family beta-xylosidase
VKPRLAAAVVAVLLILAGCSQPSTAPSSTPQPGGDPSASTGGADPTTFTNPVLGQGADPFLTVVDGRYYYVQSAADGAGVTIRSATSLASLQFAPEESIFTGGAGGAPCCEYWAPEVHQIDGRWYLYVAADDGDNNHHRSYVMESDDIAGPYTDARELKLPGDRWAIDATVLALPDGQNYVLWSGWPGPRNGEQDLYLARLASPTKVSGKSLRLSRPEHAWERQAGTVGVWVNEAPATLVHDSRVYVTYSASGCWTPDYALGLLSADLDADLLDARSWRKSAKPVFSGGDDSGEYGTGHNGFFSSPDGSQTWQAYHAVTNPEGSCGDDREVYAQPVTFASDGTPQFGKPSGTTSPLPLPAGDPGR